MLVIPGLFGNDLYLRPLRSWLSRIGYAPVRSGVSINAGCPERLRTEIERSLSPQLARRTGPIAIVGHSRGGMLGWAIASRLQERVSHLALLGIAGAGRRGDDAAGHHPGAEHGRQVVGGRRRGAGGQAAGPGLQGAGVRLPVHRRSAPAAEPAPPA